MKDIAIYGGTFDPIHIGHISMALRAKEELNLDKVILLPAQVQPFKLGKKISQGVHRLNMIKLVCKRYPQLTWSDVELKRKGISYTYDTLRCIEESGKYNKIYFILGTDSFLSLDKWYKGKELLQDFSFVVAMRPGDERKSVISKSDEYRRIYNTSIHILSNKPLNISSTDIKRRLKEGMSIGELVLPEVERYIFENELYNG